MLEILGEATRRPAQPDSETDLEEGLALYRELFTGKLAVGLDGPPKIKRSRRGPLSKSNMWPSVPIANQIGLSGSYRHFGHSRVEVAVKDGLPPRIAEFIRQQVLVELSNAEKIIEDLVDNDLCREMGIGKNELSDFRGHRVGFPRDENPFKDGFFTPSGKLEFYSETLAQGGLDPLPDHVPLAEGSETPAVLKKYPLQLIVPPIHHFLNSCFGEVEDCIFAERKPYLFIHPEDAVSRGIEEGDLVKVFNDRGENCRFAKVGERALPGVAVTEGIWWTKLSPGRKGTNQLTSERLTDLGRAAPLHSNLVEVEKVESNVAQALLEDYPQAAI